MCGYDNYYYLFSAILISQIVDLLHFKDKLTARQFQRVATRAVHFLLETKPSAGQQNLLAPLLAPLHRCSTASSWFDSHFTVTDDIRNPQNFYP